MVAFRQNSSALLCRSVHLTLVDSLLPKINVDTLIGAGTEVVWSPLSQHECIAAQIPNSKLVVFEGAGRMAPAEAVDAVTRALDKWIGESA